MQVDAVFYDRLPLLNSIDARVASSVYAPLRQVSPGVEVGKSFQAAHFAAAMPPGGRYNDAVHDGIRRLNAGEIVFRCGASSN